MRKKLDSNNGKDWKSLVGKIPHCVLCGKSPIQVAHRNQGKGIALKVPDHLTAALCQRCHSDIDNGNYYSLSERRALMDQAIIETYNYLITHEQIGIL